MMWMDEFTAAKLDLVVAPSKFPSVLGSQICLSGYPRYIEINYEVVGIQGLKLTDPPIYFVSTKLGTNYPWV